MNDEKIIFDIWKFHVSIKISILVRIPLFQEKEAFESEDSREIERIYAYLRTEQIEREKKIIKIEEEYEEEEIENKKAKKPIALTLKTPRKTSIVSTSLEKIGAKFDEEIDESEELIKRKGRRRRALSEIPLKICSMDICEPKICCAGNANYNIIILIEFVVIIPLL